MDELEIGFYSTLLTYGLIVLWTLMFRLRRLPVSVIRLVHWPLNRLQRVPLLGRIAKATRTYPLMLGLMAAALAGAVVPYVVQSSLWLLQAIVTGVVLLAGAALAFSSKERDDDGVAPNPNRLYWSVHRDEIVHGWDSRADVSRPWF